mmetsp:Transcript_98952/g.275411  ORF Transcript_98952/g.275411 Transcript_98952/m.275411 type:complete len:328 (-) Transcript_98952:635-1618(-)
MPPSNKRVPIKEALHYAGMGEVVINSPELPCHAHETRVNSQACAVHVVQDLGALVLQRLDRAIDLSVPLPQRLYRLEGSGDDAPDVAKALAVFRKQQRERQVCVADHQSIRNRIDELQPIKPAQGEQPGLVRGCIGGLVLVRHRHGCFVHKLVNWAGAVVIRDDIPQVFVAQAAKLLVILAAQLPAVLESSYGINGSPRGALGLREIDELVGDLLGARLPLASPGGMPARPLDDFDILHVSRLQHIPCSNVIAELPLCQHVSFGPFQDPLCLRLAAIQLSPLGRAVGSGREAVCGQEALQRQVLLDGFAHLLGNLFQGQVVLTVRQR